LKSIPSIIAKQDDRKFRSKLNSIFEIPQPISLNCKFEFNTKRLILTEAETRAA